MKVKIRFNFYNDRHKSKGPGRGWWGPPKGTHSARIRRNASVAAPFGASIINAKPMDDLNQDEDYEISRHSDLAADIAYELDLDEDMLAEDLTDWAIDSQSRSGLVYQRAATQEFGAKLSSYAVNRMQKLGMSQSANLNDERLVIRYIYDASRQYVGNGMTLYRGSSHRESNALESWTTDPRIAAFYVRREGGGKVLKKFFSADQILGTYQVGIGLEAAREVVVINRS